MSSCLLVSVLYCSVISVTGQTAEKAATTAPTSSEGPIAYVLEPTIDLGVVREGTVSTAKFIVENRGNEDLIIANVHASCGCTSVQLSDEEKIVKPGKQQVITVKFDAGGRVGPQRKSIRLSLNDRASPVVHLMLTADVQALFRVLPRPLINMRTVRRGADLEPLTLMPTNEGKNLELIDITMPPGFLEYETKPVEDPDGRKGIEVDLRVPAEMELGTVNNEMVIRGRVGDEEAAVRVRVAGQVVGDLDVRPLTLQSLGATPRGRRFAPVTLVSTTDRPFEVLSADAGPYIDVETEKRKDGQEYFIRTTLNNSAPDGPLATTLVVRTDNPSQPLAEIPIFVNVRPKYMLEPAIVLLGSGEKDRSRVVRLQSGDTERYKISEVYNDHPSVQYELNCKQSDVPYVRFVRVGIAGDPPAEPFETKIVFRTDIAGAEEISVPVIYRP